MSFRKNRKFKEKPAVFAFGHIMLPLVAVLALGLLVLGVRLLFVSPESQVSYPETPEYPGAETETPPVVAKTTGETQVVAVPVPDGDGPSSEPKAIPATPPPRITGPPPNLQKRRDPQSRQSLPGEAGSFRSGLLPSRTLPRP